MYTIICRHLSEIKVKIDKVKIQINELLQNNVALSLKYTEKNKIGGIEYKVLGADKGKADIFLSPKGDNYKDAIKIVKKHKLKIKVIEVESLEDAINDWAKFHKRK